ncbi:ATP-dependent DNA helicase [Ancylobacter polymorphus]|uniref:Exodeoxyribonuclease-5 n=1 Tax=Ancylobacter polymorphus TaxID=223390 RepID=A0ABU0B7W2_9HYPH|nr:AAA family ATPase [Ancylobacter polymorphus]MDQ0301418.1 exodeoxyribonuclease-5 [Ancylobacter polymorphus]
MSWSPQQEGARREVAAWLRDQAGAQVYYLAGYAGTGKTTLARDLAGDARGEVLYGAFTGKAALVLQRKGCIGASTIHSMIYKPRRKAGGVVEFVLNPESAVKKAGLVVIDECSMVDEALGKDLLSFGTKVLVLGDPAQLPPVRGEGFFTSRRPDTMLTEVHRQAQDSPIIRMSMDVREGRGLAYGAYGSSKVIPPSQLEQAEVLEAEQILIGLNKTRRRYNGRMRELRGFTGDRPNIGERLVCLKNRHSKGLLNGGLWSVIDHMRSDDPDYVEMVVEPSDAGAARMPVDVRVHRFYFAGRESELEFHQLKGTEQFDYGYALTVHKSQGSQWDSVIVFDESDAFRESSAKHLYTAITRAAERLTIVRSQ